MYIYAMMSEVAPLATQLRVLHALPSSLLELVLSLRICGLLRLGQPTYRQSPIELVDCRHVGCLAILAFSSRFAGTSVNSLSLFLQRPLFILPSFKSTFANKKMWDLCSTKSPALAVKKVITVSFSARGYSQGVVGSYGGTFFISSCFRKNFF